MAAISRTSLFGKLNSIGYRAIESATVFCKMRGNPYVELVHWIHQILQLQDSDLHRIVRHFGLEPSRLAADITATLDKLPRGSTTISDLSSQIEDSVERGWVIATLMFGESQVRTGYLLAGMLQIRSLRQHLGAISPEFEKVGFDRLTDRFAEIMQGSPEAGLQPHDGFTLDAPAPDSRQPESKIIFINYRRADSMHSAGRIYDRLVAGFGVQRVFKDIDSIPLGVRDFEKALKDTLAEMKFFLAIIGKGWLDAEADGRRRLDDPHDFVRLEIELALDSDAQIIPVLIDDTAMPAVSDLPQSIEVIGRCQAHRIRGDTDFERDVELLMSHIRTHLDR